MSASEEIPEWVDEAVEQEYASLAKREPVILTGFLGGPILGLVTLIAPGDPKKLASQITAVVVALLVVATSWFLRKFVSPKWKKLVGHDLGPMPDDTVEPSPEQVTITDDDFKD